MMLRKFLLLLLLIPQAAHAIPPLDASEGKPVASSAPERVIGTYGNGCLLGGTPFADSTSSWEVMNTLRNHQHGTKRLLEVVERLSRQSLRRGWGKLTVGDSSCPMGGKMSVGHKSHRVGLDVDIFYKFWPAGRKLSFEQRNGWDEEAQARHAIAVHERACGSRIVKSGITKMYRAAYMELLKFAAAEEAVERVFVSPAIKVQACHFFKGKDGTYPRWLRKIRPESGHTSHFHVRLSCPKGGTECEAQKPIADDPSDSTGVGCAGKFLESWFQPLTEEECKPSPPAPPPSPPAACLEEMAKLKFVSIAPEVRCLVTEMNTPLKLRCRDYKTASIYEESSHCSIEETEKHPEHCLVNPDPRLKK